MPKLRVKERKEAMTKDGFLIGEFKLVSNLGSREWLTLREIAELYDLKPSRLAKWIHEESSFPVRILGNKFQINRYKFRKWLKLYTDMKRSSPILGTEKELMFNKPLSKAKVSSSGDKWLLFYRQKWMSLKDTANFLGVTSEWKMRELVLKEGCPARNLGGVNGSPQIQVNVVLARKWLNDRVKMKSSNRNDFLTADELLMRFKNAGR